MFSMIAAMANNRVIGYNNQLPWHYPDDLRYFSVLTKGRTVIMGRHTYESIAKALGPKGPFLPGRQSIVVSTTMAELAPSSNDQASGLLLASPQGLIDQYAKSSEEFFVIGGEQLYKSFLPYTQKIYLTEIHKSYEGDTFFPEFESGFTEISRERKGEFDFVIYDRKTTIS